MMAAMASQVNYWDSVANQKTFSHPLHVEWLRKYSSEQARILDYGCGYGRTLAELSVNSFANLVGTDFSERMLLRARAEAPHAALVRNEGKVFPFANASFDVVLSFAVLTCIPADNDQQQLIAEVLRVLRPNGLLYISDLLLNDDERNRQRYEQYADNNRPYGVFELPEGVVVRHHRREWIEELTKEFRPLERESFTVTTMNGNSSAAFQYLGRK
jgi:SAM-dependent methyltransferase